MNQVHYAPVTAVLVVFASFSAVAAEAQLTTEQQEAAVSAEQEPALASPAPPPAAPISVAAEAPKASKPWAGSSITYGHAASTLSFNKAAEPLYNPNYAHRLELVPRWSFGSQLYLAGRFELAQELTFSDDTTYKYEVVASDLALDVGAKGVTDPWAGVRVGGSLRVTLPTSKAAHAQSRFLSIGPGLSLSRKFPVLAGLTVRGDARYTQRFHRYTTTQFDAPTIGACGDLRDLSCAEFLHSGVRNTMADLGYGAGLTFDPTEKLSVTSDFRMSHGWLYPLTGAEKPSLDGPVALPIDAGTNMRHNWGFILEASYQVIPELSLALGSSTLAPQLAPDGTRRTPFFNRYTTLYLDLGLNVEALLSRI